MTVDPLEPFGDLDWDPERARAFTDRTAGLFEELLRRLPELPVTRGRSADQVRDAVAIPIPEDPMPDDALFDHLREMTFEHSTYPGHPRFLAYITGAGTVPGAAADLLAAGLNMNLGGWLLSPAATEIELALTRWFARRFGLPEEAGGLIVSGGAMANFVALKVARDRRAGWDVRTEGVRTGPPLAIYLSEETHVVSTRAADLLGIGTAGVRAIPVDEGYRIRMDLLRAAIGRDRDEGIRPVAVVGSAGTVATGAVDPLDALADLCAEEGIWFHVDGAYGGPAAFAPDLRPLLSGIERADSIAFDPHKWLYTPHSGGCVLVRDLQHLADSFAVHATYVQQDKERTGRGLDFTQLGPQFSRGFWALKIWLSLLAHGARAYRERISHDAALARYLGERVRERPGFELVCPVGLSICCFRYVPSDLPEGPDREAYLDLLNERLMTEIQQDGRVFISNAVLGERFVLRVCIVNFRTESEDLDAVLEVTEELGARLDAELRPTSLRGVEV
ncbi:MAG TPA: pyridoxal-dependent decarboxylase [Actinomycetota bacterium]|jgi:glutamate/tyrosine decarboxylase-like PLP-dependent enzyme|nr:pyridoxal-dependent decarboxylase [Actinomycetota bacterium]